MPARTKHVPSLRHEPHNRPCDDPELENNTYPPDVLVGAVTVDEVIAHHRGSGVIDRKGNTNVPTIICAAEEFCETPEEIAVIEPLDSTGYCKSVGKLMSVG